jgi:hypothetical protein
MADTARREANFLEKYSRRSSLQDKTLRQRAQNFRKTFPEARPVFPEIAIGDIEARVVRAPGEDLYRCTRHHASGCVSLWC